ncbi:MarR family winged helix-turn-helix transcriptional regulator [Streptomyces polygonati]|uniref:MarR family winged helix-turn-helix transcriptional regulator n=1 Tax=Streptomyces polygonati TaxID=1617087 RepID=A0ABV8HGZ8_9ACTN
MSGNEELPDTARSARRLSIAITRLRSRLRMEAGLHATGLSISQLAVLQQVVDDGPVTAAYLATAQHVTPQSIAQNLAVLKAAGLVRAGRDLQDGRKILMTADDSGRELLTSLQTSRKAFLTRAIDALVAPEERPDLEKTIELLERLAAADFGGKQGGTL